METRGASKCRWAQPTLFQPGPVWTEAWDCPWTCEAETPVRVIEDTDRCAICPRWEPRPEASIAATGAPKL